MKNAEKRVKTRIYLQRSVPIQPKTSEILPKFCQKLDRDGGGVLDGLHALTPAGRRPGDKDLIGIGVSNKKDDVIQIQVYENMTH